MKAELIATSPGHKVHMRELASHYSVHTNRNYIQEDLKLSDRCIEAITVPAASVWPYKFVICLLSPLVEEGRLNLQTNTVMKAVEDVNAEE